MTSIETFSIVIAAVSVVIGVIASARALASLNIFNMTYAGVTAYWIHRAR